MLSPTEVTQLLNDLLFDFPSKILLLLYMLIAIRPTERRVCVSKVPQGSLDKTTHSGHISWQWNGREHGGMAQGKYIVYHL